MKNEQEEEVQKKRESARESERDTILFAERRSRLKCVECQCKTLIIRNYANTLPPLWTLRLLKGNFKINNSAKGS